MDNFRRSQRSVDIDYKAILAANDKQRTEAADMSLVSIPDGAPFLSMADRMARDVAAGTDVWATKAKRRSDDD